MVVEGGTYLFEDVLFVISFAIVVLLRVHSQYQADELLALTVLHMLFSFTLPDFSCFYENILHEMDGKERYPEFRSLMNMLESRMTADGISLSVGEDLREV